VIRLVRIDSKVLRAARQARKYGSISRQPPHISYSIKIKQFSHATQQLGSIHKFQNALHSNFLQSIYSPNVAPSNGQKFKSSLWRQIWSFKWSVSRVLIQKYCVVPTQPDNAAAFHYNGSNITKRKGLRHSRRVAARASKGL